MRLNIVGQLRRGGIESDYCVMHYMNSSSAHRLTPMSPALDPE